jgi:ADP-ribosylglycohydrolase
MPVAEPTSRRTRDHFRACLLSGAIGDALGAPIEFLSLSEIRSTFGPVGLRDYAPAYGRLGAITDDTQLTLFTAEGLIRARNRSVERGICHIPPVLRRAYHRWLDTQGETPRFPDTDLPQWRRGGLVDVPGLRARRAPGNTCLEAMRTGGPETTRQPAANDSKGCGGIMRVAPIGLIVDQVPSVFEVASQAAALSHGHPTGYLAAG